MYKYINTINYICEENGFESVNLIELNQIVLLVNAYSLFAFNHTTIDRIHFQKPLFGAIYSKDINQYFDVTGRCTIPQAYCNELLRFTDFSGKKSEQNQMYETLISHLNIFVRYIKTQGVTELTSSLRKLDCDLLTDKVLRKWYLNEGKTLIRRYRKTLPINLQSSSLIAI